MGKDTVDRRERLEFDKKARELVGRLTLKEKISLLSGNLFREEIIGAVQKKTLEHYNEFPYRAGGIPEKGIPPVLFVDGTRGVVCGRGKFTCFPAAVMRGASFDPELEEKIGEAVAEEVIEAGGNLFGGICVNIPYHPGWGRSQEAFGEDPCLVGEMGAALVRGVQKKGVIACVKHFAFNSMENARLRVNITCSKRTEREVFLPHFKKCIEAGAGAVMSAYNSYQGVPCGHHEYLLRDVLKGEWGFDGFVMSDFTWGIHNTVDALKGGMDLEMPITLYYGENLEKAVQEGRVSESLIDDSALRIVRTLIASDDRLNKERKKAGQSLHAELALRSAREGITLVKNSEQVLPLKCSGPGHRIVVLGYLADRENTGDRGSSQVYPPYVTTPLQGILREAGGAEVIYYPGGSAAHCRRLAKDADAVIIVAGNDYTDEGEYFKPEDAESSGRAEGGDRTTGLSLKKRDKDIILAVSSVRKDAIVVLEGSMILMSEWIRDTGAVLMLYYPGMEGGTALGEVLFGKTDPGGKLPFAVPENEADLPEIDWEAEEQYYGYYHGYTLMEKQGVQPLFPFGFGLSYTNFEISGLQVRQERDTVCASVFLENTGDRRGTEVVQMYVGAGPEGGSRAVQMLKAFQRVELEAGEKRKIILSCSVEDLAVYNEETGRFLTEEKKYTIRITAGSTSDDLETFFELHTGFN